MAQSPATPPERQILPLRVLLHFAFAIVLLAIGLTAIFWPVIYTRVQALVIFRSLNGVPLQGLSKTFLGNPITIENVTVTTLDGPANYRLYLPVTKSTRQPPALMMIPGLYFAGIDEPTLVQFATTAAQCGFQVMTPEIPAFKDYIVNPVSLPKIGQAAQWFSARSGGPVTVITISYAAGLTLVAAEDPRYAEYFKAIFTVGSYQSLDRLLHYYRTGTETLPDGSSVSVDIDRDSEAMVFAYQFLSDFVPYEDMPAVHELLRAELGRDGKLRDRLLLQSTPQQRQEFADLLAGKPIVKQRLLEMETKYEKFMGSLSPQGKLSQIKAQVYILHGAQDLTIPPGESLWLAQGLPPGRLKRLLISPIFAHTELAQPRGGHLWEKAKLVELMAEVLAAAKQ